MSWSRCDSSTTGLLHHWHDAGTRHPPPTFVTPLDTDYLVIGAGTAGLAFVDTLIDHSDAQITLVDERGLPGGHWNDAYPFVALHQPSAFYGVNSTLLGSGAKDRFGPNEGLYELASGPEICAYFQRVMQQRLLPSGRVDYRPLTRWLGDGQVESLLSGRRTTVNVRRKVVDARYLSPAIPSTHRPRFEVEEGVNLVPPNALPALWRDAAAGPRRFAILGAGKTAMDAAVWLLRAGAEPDSITWVVPRDAWLIARITTQPGPEFFEHSIGGQAAQLEAFAQATSVPDLFLRLEACGQLLRIDTTRTPSMFHLATIAPGEVEILRRIDKVVRLGRVQRLARDEMHLEQGRVPVAPGTVFVDCTASAVEERPVQRTFQDGLIVLQMLRLPQPAFSAALTAYVEANYADDAAKNRLCTTVPFPHRLEDYPKAMLASLWNQGQWGQDKALRGWIRDSRLDGFGRLLSGIAPDDHHKQATLGRLKTASMAAMTNLQRLSTE
jgi:hypothetical protein